MVFLLKIKKENFNKKANKKLIRGSEILIRVVPCTNIDFKKESNEIW